MTLRRPPNLDPKGRGDKSLVGKWEMSEDVYGMDLQRLRNMVRTGLSESQCPAVEEYTRRYHVCTPDAIANHGFPFRSWDALRDGRCLAKALKGMNGAPKLRSIRSSGAEHGRAYKSRDSRSRNSRSTQVGWL